MFRGRDEWPSRPDTRVHISPRDLPAGCEIVTRTRWGSIRRLSLRLWGVSSTGRPFIIGHRPGGFFCHRAWFDQIIHIERTPHAQLRRHL